MARKTMPASRKRRSPSSEEQQQQVMSVQQAQEKLAASASASAPEIDTSGVPSLPCAHIPASLDGPSCLLVQRLVHGENQNMRKWLHACKHLKQVPQLLEEMCKVLTGSFHEGNALATSYGSNCKLLFGTKKSISIQDLILSLTNLSNWMDSMRPRVNAEYCVSHCNINFTNATDRSGAVNKQNMIQSKVLSNPKNLCMLMFLQLEMMEKALCQSVSEIEARSNLDWGLFGQHPASSTLLNSLLNSLGSSCKRKKSWVGNVPRKAANLECPNRKDAFVGQKEYSTKSSKHDKVQTRIELGVDKVKPGDSDRWTSHQMSPGELESWIVKHSIPSKKRKHETMLKPKSLENIDKDCLETGRDDHIEIEVDLSDMDGSLLENEAAATDGMSDMPYVKHIMKTISVNRVNLYGQDEVNVLFKALRSDGKEIIVGNAYLRSTYPLLLATFYEQNLRFPVGKLPSGKMQWY